jgi:molybdopterin-containing oxidoreductase family iron-sulfur binding subunit
LKWCKALAPQDEELAACEDWYAFVRGRWAREVLSGAEDPGAAWEDALRRGGVSRDVAAKAPPIDRGRASQLMARELPRGEGLELLCVPHGSLYDGRFAGNAWLQELPDPVSRLVWDTAAALSPATAEAAGLSEGDLVEVRAPTGKVTFPVLIQPGTAAGVVVLGMGGGRQAGGQVSPGVGANAAPISDQDFATLERVGGGHQLVRTQSHFSMEGRPLALDGTLAEFRKDPAFVAGRLHVPEPTEIHEEFTFEGAHWGMSIDMNACTGCSLCVTACQAENNIPVVGKEECANGREMHWIRIDLYRDGDPDNPTHAMQPVTCQQCDNAPCEMVCPVQATAHSPEGLNEMAYNRCVGTRYCANNCPYKVRRFNFFDYQARQLRDPVQELVFNPSVSVRSRGVMEKCTFCVQRINEVRFREKSEGRFSPRDGAIQTACQQACPAEAIVFGDMNDPQSRVSKLRANPRSYLLLEELNAKPSLNYLARVRNPHPDAPPSVAPGKQKGGH